MPMPGAVITSPGDRGEAGPLAEPVHGDVAHRRGRQLPSVVRQAGAEGREILAGRRPGTAWPCRLRRLVLAGPRSGGGGRPPGHPGQGISPLRSLPRPTIGLEDQYLAPEPLATISGRILGLEPEELARVKVTAVRSRPLGEPTRASVDAQGSYRFEGLTQDAWWIRAEAGDRTLFETVHIPEGEARIARDLAFLPVGEVHGRIETPDQEPIEGAAVRLRHQRRSLRDAAAGRRDPDRERRRVLDPAPGGGVQGHGRKGGLRPLAGGARGLCEPGGQGRGRRSTSGCSPRSSCAAGSPACRRTRTRSRSRRPWWTAAGLTRRRRGEDDRGGPLCDPRPGAGHLGGRGGLRDLPGELTATGQVVISEEATEAVLDLSFRRTSRTPGTTRTKKEKSLRSSWSLGSLMSFPGLAPAPPVW